jgi:hypothetical protein
MARLGKVSKSESIVQKFLEVPEKVAHYFQQGERPAFVIRFSEKTIKRTQEITDGLLISRGVVSNTLRINETHPDFLYLAASSKDNDDTRTNAELLAEVRFWHDKWKERAESDATILMLTTMTPLRLDIEPKPYTEEELIEDNSVEGDWETVTTKLPPRPMNLKNPYERRLKVITDLINEADDVLFRIQFVNEIETVVPDVFRALGGRKDNDNFRS